MVYRLERIFESDALSAKENLVLHCLHFKCILNIHVLERLFRRKLKIFRRSSTIVILYPERSAKILARIRYYVLLVLVKQRKISCYSCDGVDAQ